MTGVASSELRKLSKHTMSILSAAAGDGHLTSLSSLASHACVVDESAGAVRMRGEQEPCRELIDSGWEYITHIQRGGLEGRASSTARGLIACNIRGTRCTRVSTGILLI